MATDPATTALREALDARDDGRLATLIAADPDLVNRPMLGLEAHPLGPHPLTYLALLPYALGADPAVRDGNGDTALAICRREGPCHPDEPGYAVVAALLASSG